MDRKTVTVKEVAAALNISPRAVRDRINKGELNGTQKENAYGVQEWRIYPTKELAEKLKLNQEAGLQDNDFPAMDEPVDAELMGEEGAEATPHQTWIAEERNSMKMLAEQMMQPLLDTIRQQERLIEDQSRQLKLLPDFEKQAEADRQMAINKAMEAEALSKQVEALKTVQGEAEAAKEKAAQLEQSLADQKLESEEQIQKITEEKNVELKAVSDQVAALAQSLAEMQKPWWKKMLGS